VVIELHDDLSGAAAQTALQLLLNRRLHFGRWQALRSGRQWLGRRVLLGALLGLARSLDDARRLFLVIEIELRRHSSGQVTLFAERAADRRDRTRGHWLSAGGGLGGRGVFHLRDLRRFLGLGGFLDVHGLLHAAVHHQFILHACAARHSAERTA